jgi:calcineurin-like phosphoesterase family protein
MSEPKMREDFILNNNRTVKKDDDVFHNGDFAMLGPSQWEKLKNILSKLNGRHHLILGNHDEIKPFRYVDCGFTSVHTSYVLECEGTRVILNHDPSVYCVIPEGAILACAHIHTLFKCLPDKRVINVGVDMWGYKPVALEKVVRFVQDQSRSL